MTIDEDDVVTDFTEQVVELLARISPLLAGKPPEVIGATLADLLATYLAGHMGDGQDALREALLDAHLIAVRELVPVNEELILEKLRSLQH
jgi:hypothetical protein